eukprot:scaffold404_cov101-Isochrysis_galbana.AAC.5
MAPAMLPRTSKVAFLCSNGSGHGTPHQQGCFSMFKLLRPWYPAPARLLFYVQIAPATATPVRMRWSRRELMSSHGARA